jgi:hypothetical protein
VPAIRGEARKAVEFDTAIPGSSPERYAGRRDLRRDDALGRLTVVVEGEQGVAGGIDRETVVGRRRQIAVGDQDAVVRPELDAEWRTAAAAARRSRRPRCRTS